MQYIWHLAECACAWMQWIQWHSAIHNQLQQRSDWAVSLRRGSISFQWQLVLLSSFCIACHAIVWSGSVIGSKNRYDTDKWMYMEYTSFFLAHGLRNSTPADCRGSGPNILGEMSTRHHWSRAHLLLNKSRGRMPWPWQTLRTDQRSVTHKIDQCLKNCTLYISWPSNDDGWQWHCDL